MASPRREKISAVDTAWLRMDQPGNLMMITGVLLLHRRVPLARLSATIEKRFLRFKRFRQRPVQSAGMWYWQTYSAFGTDAHVIAGALPPKSDPSELQALVSRLASTPLDAARPLWQFQLIDHYQGGS